MYTFVVTDYSFDLLLSLLLSYFRIHSGMKDGDHSHTLGKGIEASRAGRHRNRVLRASVTSSKVSSGPLCGETEPRNYERSELAVEE